MSTNENLNFDPLKCVSNADENLAIKKNHKTQNENSNLDKENL